MTVKSALADNEAIVTVPLLLFLTVTVFVALVVPISCAWNVKAAGENISGALGPPAPLPDKFANWVAKETPVTPSAPLIKPFCLGLKVTKMVHLDLPGKLFPQGRVPPPVAL
jgi:hypothetical protein